MVITISRQYGAGGSEVARLIAARLGWSVVDNEIIDRVAERAGLSPVDVARQEERAPSFIERRPAPWRSHRRSWRYPSWGPRSHVTSPAWCESPKRWSRKSLRKGGRCW
jgi:hypothetical protein